MGEVTLESQLIDIIKDEDMAEDIKLAKLDMLVRLGVKSYTRDENRTTALMLACQMGHKKIAEFLISKRADVNAKNDKGLRAIHLAS